MDLLTTYIHDLELQAINTATAHLHTLQITIAHAKPQSSIVFPSRCLATAHNSPHAVANWLILLATEFIASTILVITSRHCMRIRCR
jgi:hypothetical protein